MLQTSTNPTTTVQTRRKPCYGLSAALFLKDQFPQLYDFLVTLRNELIKILDPDRQENNTPRKLDDLIKVKDIHAACYGIIPFLDKDAYCNFFEKPLQENGFGGKASLKAMAETLQIYLQQKSPVLIPIRLEFNEIDGCIFARCKFVTNDDEEYPLPPLKQKLDPRKTADTWDGKNANRNDTVTIVLCTTATIDLKKREEVNALISSKSSEFEELGAQPITHFKIVSYNKRTLTLGKHARVYADVEAECINHSANFQI